MLFLFSLVFSTFSLLSAHVTIAPAQFPSGATSIMTFNLAHGCNSTSLTNRVELTFPSNLSISMKPIDKVGWKVSRFATEMPYETSPGSGIKANSFKFVWETDTAIYQGLPDWAFDTVQVRITMPAATAVAIGSKWFVPVLQYCTGGLLDAWNATTTSTDSHAGDLPAPSFTIISTTDVQPVPSQANVKFLSDSLANLTALVQPLLSGKVPTSAPSNATATTAPTSAPTAAPGSSQSLNAGSVSTTNYYTDSSNDWRKSDGVAVAAIVIAGISILASFILLNRIHQLEIANAQLSGAAAVHNKL